MQKLRRGFSLYLTRFHVQRSLFILEFLLQDLRVTLTSPTGVVLRLCSIAVLILFTPYTLQRLKEITKSPLKFDKLFADMLSTGSSHVFRAAKKDS